MPKVSVDLTLSLPPMLLSCSKALRHYTAFMYYASFSSFQPWVSLTSRSLMTLIALRALAGWTFYRLFLKRELCNFFLMIRPSYLWLGEWKDTEVEWHSHPIVSLPFPSYPIPYLLHSSLDYHITLQQNPWIVLSISLKMKH